jgi:hypothetical protein
VTNQQLTMEEAIAAGERAMALVEEAAEAEWKAECHRVIEYLDAGMTFIAEEIVGYVNLTFATPNNKAIGPVIRRCANAGLIRKTGRTRPARTSHGSPKPEWVRV